MPPRTTPDSVSFELISRDAIHGLLLSATKYHRSSGCYIAAVVFARKLDADAWLITQRPARFDMLEPIMLRAPGGLFAVISVDPFTLPTMPDSVPCAGHIAAFGQKEMSFGGAVDLALKLEKKIAELAFEHFEPRRQEVRPVSDAVWDEDPDKKLGQMVRKMQELGESRLVCATELNYVFWYVLLTSKDASVVIGSGTTPEQAIGQALEANR